MKYTINQSAEVICIAIIITALSLILDQFLSSKFGILSEPIVYDGIAYCLKGEKLYNIYLESGFLDMLKHSFSLREPFWDVNIAMSYIINGTDHDNAAYYARFLGIFATVASFYFIAKKYSDSLSFSVTIVTIAAFIPLLSPNSNAIFSFSEIKAFKVLSDLRPDFMWGALLFCTIVYMKENLNKNSNSHFFLIGLLTAFVVIAKGSMAPVSLAILGSLGIMKLIYNKDKLSTSYFGKTAIALAPILIVLGLWYYFGGLESNVDRIKNVVNNKQMIRKYNSYSSKYLGFFIQIPFQIGLSSIFLSFISLLYALINIRRKKLRLEVLFYFLFPFFMYLFQAINGPNSLKGTGAALTLYSGIILILAHAFKSFNGISKSKLEYIFLTILSLFIIFKFVIIQNGLVHYQNQITNYEYANQRTLRTAKETYEEMLNEIGSSITNETRIFNNVYLFGGNEGIHRHLNFKVKGTWMNITHPKEVFLQEIKKSDIILIDADISKIRIHPQRKKHFDWLQEYLRSNKDFKLTKTYTIDIFKNQGSLQNKLQYRPRNISYYKKSI